MKENEIQITEETMCNSWCDCSMYKNSECFEFFMKYGDCQYCMHIGDCEYECNEMRDVDYIREQLDKISNEQMYGYISYYICDEDISDKVNDRDWLELYLIWLVSGDIIDDISMGYAEYRVCG